MVFMLWHVVEITATFDPLELLFRCFGLQEICSGEFSFHKIFPLIRMNVNGNVRQKRQLSSRQAPLSDSFKFNNFLLFLPYSWAISKTQSSKLLFVLNVLTNRAKDPFHSKKQWKENSWTKYRHYITCVWWFLCFLSYAIETNCC